MKQNRLSLFSYFGGKARFCKDIAELLDYNNTDIYIEPFGGAASVLLNKPAHGIEYYSDVSRGLVALMGCLSDPDKAPELIDRLYDTEYSKEFFDKCVQYRNSVDDNYYLALQQQALRRQEQFARKIKRRIDRSGLLSEIGDNPTDAELRAFADRLLEDKRIFSEDDRSTAQALAEELDNDVMRAILTTEYFEQNEDLGVIEEPDEFELAVATYVAYSMSRDGLGSFFSSVKFKSNEAYYRRIDNLYEVSERLRDVRIVGAVGALTYLLEPSFLNEPRAMFYIDAPYLSADEENRNLGRYKGQMEVEHHKLLLETIVQSKAKFLISNYDSPIYNEYLRGWNKATIDTTTSVGMKRNSQRTECLWYNY